MYYLQIHYWLLVIFQIVVPLLNWETATFSRPVLAVFVVASLSLFPILLLPSSPSMWVAGMTFGYGYGFLLIFPAIAVGVSLPYFIGSLFYHKIQVGSFLYTFYSYWKSYSISKCLYVVVLHFSGMARKLSKESIHVKICWWRKLVSPAQSRDLDQTISVPLHLLQLLFHGNKCPVWSLPLGISIRNDSGHFCFTLHVG